MSITINGTGTISGISVGGLENGCVNADDLATAAVTNSKLAANAVTIDKLGTTEQSQLCKAWVNFDGTLVTNPGSATGIRASYNVSSITDNNPGDYTVNFTTALADANYAGIVTTEPNQGANASIVGGVYFSSSVYSTTQMRVFVHLGSNGGFDRSFVTAAVFR
jgi:hypothetical protein